MPPSAYPAPKLYRSNPITTIENNFDKLYIPPDSLSRSPKYTRYLNDGQLLRTHTTAVMPELLPQLSGEHLIVHLIQTILNAVLPDVTYRLNETAHPYTCNGVEVEVRLNDTWIEVALKRNGSYLQSHPTFTRLIGKLEGRKSEI